MELGRPIKNAVVIKNKYTPQSGSTNYTNINCSVDGTIGNEINENSPEWDARVSFAISIIILSLILNAVNSGILFSILKRKLRPVNCMIANLALVSIIASGFVSLWIGGLDKIFKQLWICCLFSYFRNVSMNLISLGVAGISYERVRSLDENSIGELLVGRLIGMIWLFSFLGAIPSLFTTVLVHHVTPCGEIQSMCMKTSPLDNFALGIVYEVFRTAIFHLAVSGHLIYEVLKVRSKVQNFYSFANRAAALRKKLDRVRFIYINSITFIVIWVPFGIILGLYKNTTLANRHNEFKEKGYAIEKDRNERSVFFYIMGTLFYIYILTMPFISYCTNDALFKPKNKAFISSKSEDPEDSSKKKEMIECTMIGDTTRHVSSSMELEIQQDIPGNDQNYYQDLPQVEIDVNMHNDISDCDESKPEENFTTFSKEFMV